VRLIPIHVITCSYEATFKMRWDTGVANAGMTKRSSDHRRVASRSTKKFARELVVHGSSCKIARQQVDVGIWIGPLCEHVRCTCVIVSSLVLDSRGGDYMWQQGWIDGDIKGHQIPKLDGCTR
jgi:hypothetical protein